MNDLSAAVLADRKRYFAPVPAAVPRVLIPLFLASIGVSIFILVVVHNAALLVSVLVVAALVLGLFVWNASAHRRSLAIRLFLEQFPETDLVKANDGQLVKVTGFASCGDFSLESSYEKDGRCVYTSTLLYEYRGCQLKQARLNHRCFQWNLAYVEKIEEDQKLCSNLIPYWNLEAHRRMAVGCNCDGGYGYYQTYNDDMAFFTVICWFLSVKIPSHLTSHTNTRSISLSLSSLQKEIVSKEKSLLSQLEQIFQDLKEHEERIGKAHILLNKIEKEKTVEGTLRKR